MAEILSDNKIKTIAFYLPQYHAIPENDKFWGKEDYTIKGSGFHECLPEEFGYLR